jgi:hypothetical protein
MEQPKFEGESDNTLKKITPGEGGVKHALDELYKHDKDLFNSLIAVRFSHWDDDLIEGDDGKALPEDSVERWYVDGVEGRDTLDIEHLKNNKNKKLFDVFPSYKKDQDTISYQQNSHGPVELVLKGEIYKPTEETSVAEILKLLEDSD